MNFLTEFAVVCIVYSNLPISVSSSCSGQVLELTDVSRRSHSYIMMDSSEPFIKDSTLQSGWYSVKDNSHFYTMTSETVPELAHCGTLYPIYLKDAVPKVMDEGKEYDQVACLVSGESSCKIPYNIKIRRCGSDIQYFLIPTDGESAYCFEPTAIKVIAPAPNYRIPGTLTVSVALMYVRGKDKVLPEIEFKCNFDAINQYYYEVNWAINGRIEMTFPPQKLQNIDTTNLNETTIRKLGFSLGFSVQCWVSVLSEPTGNKTTLQKSDSFYAGVRIVNPLITIDGGETQYVQIQPTIPMGCQRLDLFDQLHRVESCELDIQMYDPNSNGYTCSDTSVVTISDQKRCGTRISGWRRNSGYNCLERHNKYDCSSSTIQLTISSIPITITNDRLQYPEDRTFTLQLKTGDNGPHKLWENVTLEEIKVLYSGGSGNSLWKGKSCTVKNDPYVIPFDGGNYYLSENGYFLMYNNTDQLQDVQVRTRPCDADSSAWCTCAVAVQAGGDVFVFDICSDVNRASFSHCRGNVLNVREINSQQYQIYFPSGTKVEVGIRSWANSMFLNTDIYPSPADVGKTEGLCGNLDGITESTSSAQWRLTRSTLNTITGSFLQSWQQTQEMCICPQVNNLSPVTLKPGELDQRAFCFKEQYATCTRPMQLPGEKKSCTIRNKRSALRHQLNIERLVYLSIDKDSNRDGRIRKGRPVSPKIAFERGITKTSETAVIILVVSDGFVHADDIFQRSSGSTFTEAQAYDECLKTFRSKQAYSLIDELPAVPLNDSLFACANDLVHDGQEFWKDENYNSWSNLIAMEISRNKTYRNVKSNIVSVFQNITCPFQCNGNGDCVNGSCVCRDDYVGDSCFVKKSSPIEMTDLEGGGICDLIHGDDCHECLQFHTNNLLRNFRCQIKADEIDINGTLVHSDEHVRAGEYESIFEGYCCPSATSQRKKRSAADGTFVVRYHISISNDGAHFGPGRFVHVFDSTCQDYTVTSSNDWIFNINDNTCYISGQCYRNGDSVLGAIDDVCCPSLSKFHWSNRNECSKTKSSDGTENDKTTIIAVCASVSGVLIVSCVVIFAIWTYKTKARSVASSMVDFKNENTTTYTNAISNQRFDKKRDLFLVNSPPEYTK